MTDDTIRKRDQPSLPLWIGILDSLILKAREIETLERQSNEQ